MKLKVKQGHDVELGCFNYYFLNKTLELKFKLLYQIVQEDEFFFVKMKKMD